jgi:hypothetical protein
MGCTMGIATCAKSKQNGAEFDLSFEGVKTLGEFAQMHLVRKFTTS